MDIKIGHVVVALFFLVFMISGYSLFLVEADRVTGASTNLVTSSLGDLESNLSGVEELNNEFTQGVDNTSDYTVSDVQSNEIRGAESIGVINILSKNILTNFFNEVADKLTLPRIITVLVVSVFGATILLLFIKFFWEKKVF